ncbi:MAG: CPBP family intramembrane metalloprotease [Pseudomonadales bacterium]|nr:CPBP family intramembrane metalloprotease [Pseudomonadales bacterium]
MKIPGQFFFHHFFETLATIDKESAQESQTLTAESRSNRIIVIFFVTAVCLLLVNYLKYSSSYFATLGWLGETFGSGRKELILFLRQSEFYTLFTHAWWGSIHLLGYALIPMMVVKWGFKQSIADYGWQLGTVKQHLKWYLSLAFLILILLTIVSFRPDFQSHYPFYKYAHRSWADFVGWEIIYIIQFISLEFFFRGFIVNGLRPYFGSSAVFIMCLPYLMIHFPKPWLEASGAIFFGLFLGMLALRSRSIWGGVGVHVTIALSMDVAALLQTKGLPNSWWP